MIQHAKTAFRQIRTILPEIIPSTTAGVTDTIASSDGYGENFDITLHCSTGDIYFNASTVAVTASNGFKLNEDQTIDITVLKQINIIGNTTTAAYQAIIWR